MPGGIRVTEVLAALSLTMDLTSGVPLEHGLATCAVATAFGEALGLSVDENRAVFHTALLQAVGCSSHASENAEIFDDDIEFEAHLKVLDPGDPVVFARQMSEFGSWAGPRQPEFAARFLELAGTVGVAASRGSCEVSRAIGPRLGIPEAAIVALDDVHERWDGRGMPDGRSGDALSLAGRVVHIADQAVRARTVGGDSAALAEVARRSGGHLDPVLSAAFLQSGQAILECLRTSDLLRDVIRAEPGLPLVVAPPDLDRLCVALSMVADLKGRFLLGHSTHVAELASRAGAALGLDAEALADLRAAALLHDLGRAAVSSSIWDRPGPLGEADRERVRLHAYWTGRILQRCPGLAHLAPVASAHHERVDGSGYHRGVGAPDQPLAARILAAADVFAALTEDRPHRPAFSPADASAVVLAEVEAGSLDRAAALAVIEAGGVARPKLELPCGLTEREVEVLALVARGLSNRDIASALNLSDRTVGHHLAHVYDKTGRRTRAGAAVFAMEHGLLGLSRISVTE